MLAIRGPVARTELLLCTAAAAVVDRLHPLLLYGFIALLAMLAVLEES